MKFTDRFIPMFGALLAGLALGSYSANWHITPSNVSAGKGIEMRSAKPDRSETIGSEGHAGIDTDAAFTGLLTAIRNPGAPFEGHIAFCRSLEKIDAKQIPDLISRAQKLPLRFRKELLAGLLERWFETDKTAAKRWLEANGNCTGELVGIWVRFAPEDALRAILSHPDPYWGDPSSALNQIAGTEPNARIAVLAKFPRNANRTRAMVTELSDWSRKDPKEAFQAARALLTGVDKERVEQNILNTWARMDPIAAARKVQEVFPSPKAGPFGDGFMTRFTEELAAKDPSVAMNFAMSLDPSLQEYPLVAAAVAWAKVDPEGALAWSYENGVDVTSPVRSATSYSGGTVLWHSLAQDPKDTLQWLLALPQDARRDHVLAEACSQQIASTPSAEILAHPQTMVDDLYEQLPTKDQTWLASEIGSRVVKDGAFPDFNVWTARFGDGPARAAAIAGAVGKIFSDTPERAEHIVDTLPEGPERDGAITKIVEAQIYNRSADAAQRSLQISDPDSRHDALDDAVQQWLKQDGNACQAWLKATKDIPAEWVQAWVQRTDTN